MYLCFAFQCDCFCSREIVFFECIATGTLALKGVLVKVGRGVSGSMRYLGRIDSKGKIAMTSNVNQSNYPTLDQLCVFI